jgi:2-dehydro-3-deoxy-D-gluconate 5-dehydrogenase
MNSVSQRIFDVAGRVALVTGGRRGLGRAMTLGLVDAGAKVAVVAQSEEADELRREVAARGGELLYLRADLARRADRAGLVQRVVQHFGRIDILVNNAGLQHRAPAAEYPPPMWDQDLELLLTAVMDLSQQAAAPMIAQGGGKIVHLASISSFQGARQIVGYATAKHGLVGLTKCLANEWAPHGVNVNAIAPGIFETEMAGHVTADAQKSAELRSRIPAGRFGRPEDIVGPLLFLASDASRHVHGHVLLVDGGWMGR